MPRRTAYQVQWSPETHTYEILIDQAPEHLTPDSPAWFDWLTEIGSFAFSGQSGAYCTVLKERVQRGCTYWYGYRSLHGRTVKRYLGRTQDLSIARLEEIATLLANESPSRQPMLQQKQETPLLRPASASSLHQSPAEPHITLLTSRLHPPRLPASLIERTRLFALLEAGLSHPLTLLQAPAGFGKTTLVTQWVARHHTESSFPEVAWVTLEASDNDPFRFWSSIITACQALQQHLGQAALVQLASSAQSPFEGPPLETVLTRLLNDLAAVQQDALLVLDDYHAITEPYIHETLTFFLDHLPTTWRVLLLSRAEPRLPLLRWRARGDLAELHLTDLRFSSEETAIFLRQLLPTRLSATTLIQVDMTLQGWAAGLRLLVLTLQGRMTGEEIVYYLLSLGEHSGPSFPPRPLLDYFVTEILNVQPEPLQLFLLQTSVLSRLNGALCDAVISREDSAETLEGIARAGLFLEVLDENGMWYRYHPLFTEALRREATSRLGHETLRMLSLRASYWYEQHARPAEAIEAALLASEVERAALLIEQADADKQFWGPQTLCRWLAQMPEKVLHAHPALCLDYAMALRFQEGRNEGASLPEEVKAHIAVLCNCAEESWRNQDKLAEVGGVYAFRMLNALGQEPFQRVVEYARLALSLLPTDQQDRSVQVGRGACLSFVGIEHIREGRYQEARQCIQEAYTCSLISGDRHFTLSMVTMLGSISLALGELRLAVEYYHQALSSAREQEANQDAAQALSSLAWLSLEWNELTAAEQQAHEALTLLSDTEHELGDRIVFQLALLQHARGQTSSALQQLAALLVRLQLASTPWSLWLLPDVLSQQARLHLAIGDHQAAQHDLETLAHHNTLDFVQCTRVRILEARLLLAQGQANAAQLELAHLFPIAQERCMMRTSLEIQVLLSLAHAACQQPQDAHHWLAQALSQACNVGFLRLFLDEGEPLAHLLHSLLPTIQEKGLRSYAQTILHAFTMSQGEGSPGSSLSQDWLVEPLSPQEQRVLRLLAAGHTNPQIARQLIVSVNTVKHHIKHLYQKLGVSNRLEATEAARQLNLL